MTARTRITSHLAMIIMVCGVAFTTPWMPARAADGGDSPAGTQLTIGLNGGQGNRFDVQVEPGKTGHAPIVMTNGAATMQAVTYSGDAQATNNGGFGMGPVNSPKTGPTRWLTYPTQRFEFQANSARKFEAEIHVPKGTAPGQYGIGLAIENSAPNGKTSAAIGLSQIQRMIALLVVDVPGQQNPSASIGDAGYEVLGRATEVTTAITNSGSQILKPDYEVALKDANGNVMQDQNRTMGTWVTGTSTNLVIYLPQQLPDGNYFVDARLWGGGLADQVMATNLPFSVGAGTAPLAAPHTSIPLWVWILAGLILIVVILWVSRRARRPKATGDELFEV